MAVNGGPNVLGDLFLQQVGRTDGELDNFQTPGHFANGIVMGLAMLGADRLCKLVGRS